MAILNGNSIYLTWDGVSLAGKFTEVTLDSSSESVDSTAGNATFMQRLAGLRDTTAKITVAYDIALAATHIAKFKPGTIAVLDYGPEGNTAGKPRHTQSMHLTSVSGPSVTTKKDMVKFELNLECADAPSADLFNGGVFS